MVNPCENTYVHVSNTANGDYIGFLSQNYIGVQGLLEAASHHDVIVGIPIYASQT